MTPAEQYQREAEELYPYAEKGLPFSTDEFDHAQALKRAAYITGRSKSDWVSVKERLPETSNLYMVFIKGNDYTKHLVIRFYASEGSFDDHNSIITHWQPLPEPPTQ